MVLQIHQNPNLRRTMITSTRLPDCFCDQIQLPSPTRQFVQKSLLSRHHVDDLKLRMALQINLKLYRREINQKLSLSVAKKIDMWTGKQSHGSKPLASTTTKIRAIWVGRCKRMISTWLADFETDWKFHSLVTTGLC